MSVLGPLYWVLTLVVRFCASASVARPTRHSARGNGLGLDGHGRKCDSRITAVLADGGKLVSLSQWKTGTLALVQGI
jgi:hypothetical protein